MVFKNRAAKRVNLDGTNAFPSEQSTRQEAASRAGEGVEGAHQYAALLSSAGTGE